MMHELIDKEDPRCLYCGSECDFKVYGIDLAAVQPLPVISSDAEMLDCRSCKERFIIHSDQTPTGETVYQRFFFSCKDLMVAHHYDKDMFAIFRITKSKKKSLPDNSAIWVPSFEVDFSDKKKLHKKLETYVVFS